MLTRIGTWALGWGTPWTNVYGVARSLLAVGTLLTLLANDTRTLFRPAAGIPVVPDCTNVAGMSAFCLAPSVEAGRWISVFVLAAAASGWRPMLTALPHWWVTFGFQASAITLDGGDHVTAVLTLLLLPVALTDRRKWHWDTPSLSQTRESLGARLLARSAMFVIRVQMAGIYLHAAVGKLAVAEWADGTALYYWLLDPAFGAPDWLLPIIRPILVNAWGVTLLTWSAVLLELFLFMALVMPPEQRWIPLRLGLVFHAAIAVVQGLGSFAFAMSAGLVLYLRPPDLVFDGLRHAKRQGALDT